MFFLLLCSPRHSSLHRTLSSSCVYPSNQNLSFWEGQNPLLLLYESPSLLFCPHRCHPTRERVNYGKEKGNFVHDHSSLHSLNSSTQFIDDSSYSLPRLPVRTNSDHHYFRYIYTTKKSSGRKGPNP